MREQGSLVAIESDSVWVETSRQTACGSCSAQKGCGTSVLAKLFPGRQHFVRVLASPEQLTGLEIGQEVTIEVSDEIIVASSLLMYVLPIILLLAGAGLGQYWDGSSDGMAIAGGALGLLLGLVLVRSHAWLNRNNPQMQPTLVQTSSEPLLSSQLLELS